MEFNLVIEQHDETAADPTRAVNRDDLDYESYWFEGPMTVFKGYHPRTSLMTLVRVRTDLLLEVMVASSAGSNLEKGFMS